MAVILWGFLLKKTNSYIDITLYSITFLTKHCVSNKQIFPLHITLPALLVAAFLFLVFVGTRLFFGGHVQQLNRVELHETIEQHMN